MHIFQLAGDKVFYSAINGKVPTQIKEWSGESIASNVEDVLVLDYETYHNPNEMHHLFLTFPFLKNVQFVYSPYETIGAFTKDNNRNISDDINILDSYSNKLYFFTLSFSDGFYHLKSSNPKGTSLSIDQLIENNLGISPSRMVEFIRFLDNDAGDQKKYGQVINEALLAFESGLTEYDDILAILDQPEWAHIKLSDLIKFKKLLIGIAGIDASSDFKMIGWLNTLFGKDDMRVSGCEKIYGVLYLKQHADQFYPNLSEGVDFEVYCYPNLVRVPVFAESIIYSEYTLTKTVEIMDTGSLILIKGGRQLEVKTKNKMLRTILNFKIDGNQNLMINIAPETYLLA